MNFHEWYAEIKPELKWIGISLLFLYFCCFIDKLAGQYTTDNGRAVANDLILDHIPVIDFSIIYVWLYIAVVAVMLLYPLCKDPKMLPYILLMFGLFVIVRAIATTLTHLKTPLEGIEAEFPSGLQAYKFKNDLFFSGHTGLPFMAYWIYKEHKPIAIFMLASTIILAVSVLFMHTHYSIDILGALFIAYGLYRIGNHYKACILRYI